MNDPKKISHRDKYLCSNCLYSGKAGGSVSGHIVPRTCPSCQASDCCKTVWYRLRFPSKDASKQRWKEALTAMGWIERAKTNKSDYDDFVVKVVNKAMLK